MSFSSSINIQRMFLTSLLLLFFMGNENQTEQSKPPGVYADLLDGGKLGEKRGEYKRNSVKHRDLNYQIEIQPIYTS